MLVLGKGTPNLQGPTLVHIPQEPLKSNQYLHENKSQDRVMRTEASARARAREIDGLLLSTGLSFEGTFLVS